MGNGLKASIDMNTGYAWTKSQGVGPFAKAKAKHNGLLKLDLNLGKGFLRGGFGMGVLFRGEERFMAGGQARGVFKLFGKLTGFIEIGGGVSVSAQGNNENISPVSVYLMPSMGLQITGKKVGFGLSASMLVFIGEGSTPLTTGFIISLCTSFHWQKGAKSAQKKAAAK